MASEHLTTQLSSSVVGTCVLSYIKLVMCLVACPYRTCRTIPPTTPIFRCDHWGQVNREVEVLYHPHSPAPVFMSRSGSAMRRETPGLSPSVTSFERRHARTHSLFVSAPMESDKMQTACKESWPSASRQFKNMSCGHVHHSSAFINEWLTFLMTYSLLTNIYIMSRYLVRFTYCVIVVLLHGHFA